jgi:hypothetical protein
MIIGIDVSLRSAGMVKLDRYNNLYILADDSNLGLSVSSSMNDIIDIAESVALHIPNYSTVLIDATKYRFKARISQQEQLHSFIGAIAAFSKSYVYRVEPKAVRKVLGLPLRCNKSETWNYISETVYEQVPDNVSEHVLDAIVLADVYKRYGGALEVW